MRSNQEEYIEYAKDFASKSRVHVWLGGSFLRGNPTPYSDVDISVLMKKDTLREFIYGYKEPIYISCTTNPEGIIIVIYEDGVALDLEVIESVNAAYDDYFHLDRIKNYEFSRNSSVGKELSLRHDLPYQTARLFHRSLIKYLAGKKDIGVSVANEIASFLGDGSTVTESDYKHGITSLIEQYHDKYPLDAKYHNLCLELIGCIESQLII